MEVKNLPGKVILFFSMIFFCFGNVIAQEATYKDGLQEGIIRIKIKPELSGIIKEQKVEKSASVVTGVESFDSLNKKVSAVELTRVFRYSPKHEDKLIKHGLNLWYEVKFVGNADVKSVVSQYKNLDAIELAEPIYEKSLIEPGTPVKINKVGTKSSTVSDSIPFNDPYLPRQWNYKNTGQTGYPAGADINLFKAWEITTGSNNVVVSIHDMGIQYDHEDLVQNMWRNEAELNGQEGVDDDGNGYIDDLYGFNFADNVGEIAPADHATHVAGTVAAVNNNGIGVSGIAGGDENTPGVKLMSCQILGGVSQGNTPESYVYAANNGAVISQNSWGYSESGVYEQSVLDAIDYFIEEAGQYEGSPMKGGIVIFAAGNSYVDGDWYPGCYENVLAVSSLDALNNKASYSNYGTWVDISAPGGDLIDDMEDYYSTGILSTLSGDGYGYLEGTSMACPHVSGIAALVVSEFGSDEFTPAALRTHLLTGVNDLYKVEGNASYADQLGSGSADAFLALGKDDGIAPDGITNLALIGISQDFAVLQWTVPADEDDDLPHNFQIVYSKQEISDETLAYAKKEIIDVEGEVGDTVVFEVDDLDALTEYYFSIRSIDRWANVSEFSNVVTDTTNEGPDAWIDQSGFAFELEYIGYDPVTYESFYDTTYYLPVNIDAQTSTNGTGSFYLHNSGVGALKWDAEQRHVSTVDAYSATYKRYPKLVGTLEGKKADIKQLLLPKSSIQVLSQETTHESMYYFDDYASFYYVGETDLSYSNSEATRFLVSDPEGFNLTNVEMLMNYTSSEESPVIFEVYTGETLENAKITYVQELTNVVPGWNYFALNEQIFLEEGTYFWLVMHVPAGTLYPLGTGVETSQENSLNCFVSFDFGKSWTLFEDMYGNNLLTWAIAPISTYKTPGEYFSVVPLSGNVDPNDSTNIEVSIDASKFINGTYKANVVLNTNEVGEPMLRAPVTFEVSGQKAIIKGDQMIDLGSTVLGMESIHTISIKNIGYGKFKYPSVNFSNSEFSLATSYLNTINPQSDYTFDIKYTPTKLGNSNTKVTLSNYYGDEYSFFVSAVAAEPPVAELSPDSVYFDDVAIGDTLSGEFYLKNMGNYPLVYSFPSFDDSIGIETSGEIQKFGYSASNNQGGVLSTPVYNWYEISETGTSVTDYSRENGYWFYPVDLGFEFPFFGKTETQAYITNFGLVSFDMNSVFNSNPISYKDQYNPDRMITALGQRFNLTDGGAIYYQNLGDVFVIQYDKVVYLTYDWNTGSNLIYELTFEIVLHDDGNISMYYKDLGGIDAASYLFQAYVGIEDQNQDDGLLITDNRNTNLTLADNTAIEFVNPGLGLLYELSNPSGIVAVNDSVHFEFKAKTDILNMGLHIEKVPVITNDPKNNPGIFSIHMNVTKGGEPDIVALDSIVDFGNVYLADNVSQNFWLVNKGKANDTLVSVSTKGSYFDIEGDQTAVFYPNRRQLFKISPKTNDLGLFNDTLVIISKVDTLEIPLIANVIEAPVIEIDLTSISDTLDAGEVKTYPLTVTNSGKNDLYVAPVSTSWVNVSKKAEGTVSANQIAEFTYNWTVSSDENGPVYSWTEIKNTGTLLDKIYPFKVEEDITFFSEAIELPFSFNFYGIQYSSIHVGANGVITLDEPTGTFYGFGPSATFPNSAEPNNLIAPLWGFQADDYYAEEKGVFYKVEDDHVIVEWLNFLDGFAMGDAISYQAIIYANGNIKFQYNYGNSTSPMIINQSAVGIENEDGTEGTTISYREGSVVADQTAILLTPVQRYTVEPGASMAFDISVDAKDLFAGVQTYNLELLNNDPTADSLFIPINITVEGDANLVYSDHIDFGQMTVTDIPGAASYEPQFVSYVKNFELVNSGVDSVEIFSFDLSKVQNTTIEAYVNIPNFIGTMVWQWANVQTLPTFDWMTGTANQIFIAPKSSMQFRATVTPESKIDINDTLLIGNDYLDSTALQIVFTGESELPPVLNSSEEEIHVYTNTEDEVKNYSFFLDNKSGASLLDYGLALSIKREATSSVTTANKSVSVNSVGANQIQSSPFFATTESVSSANSLVEEEYNRILQHEDSTVFEGALGYGGSAAFVTATRFKAPTDGFNLTNVHTWYVPGDWLSSDIEVEIYAGDSLIQNSRLIYTERFNHTITESDSDGELLTFELADNQVIYPGEFFFIVLKYPTGASYPQAVTSVDEVVDFQFLYGDGTTWYDLNDAGYEGYGWIVHAVEKEAKSSLWVELVSTGTDTIQIGDSSTVELKFTAAYAPDIVNYAELHVRSNDPANEDAVIPVYLHKNQGPVFNPGEELSITINENDSVQLVISAVDPENDNFVLNVTETNEFITYENGGNALNFEFTPDYESQGTYSISILGEDEHGNSNSFSLNVEVLNVNRAPEAVAIDTIEMYENGFNAFVSLSELFNEPDGDELGLISYNVTTDSIVGVYESGTNFVLISGKVGITTVTFTAEDTEGASATNTIVVKVIKGVETGIGDMSKLDGVQVYPTITDDKVYVNLAGNTNVNLSIAVLNTDGSLIKQLKAQDIEGNLITLRLKELPAGIYFVRIVNDNETKSEKVIKQ